MLGFDRIAAMLFKRGDGVAGTVSEALDFLRSLRSIGLSDRKFSLLVNIFKL